MNCLQVGGEVVPEQVQHRVLIVEERVVAGEVRHRHRQPGRSQRRPEQPGPPAPGNYARKDTRWAGSISGGWVTTAGPHGSLTAPRSVCAAAPLPPASGPAHGRQPAITPATSSAAKLSGDVVGTTIMMPSEATVDYALSQPGGRGAAARARGARELQQLRSASAGECQWRAR